MLAGMASASSDGHLGWSTTSMFFISIVAEFPSGLRVRLAGERTAASDSPLEMIMWDGLRLGAANGLWLPFLSSHGIGYGSTLPLAVCGELRGLTLSGAKSGKA